MGGGETRERESERETLANSGAHRARQLDAAERIKLDAASKYIFISIYIHIYIYTYIYI